MDKQVIDGRGGSFNPDSDNLMSLHFGQGAFSFTDQFNGNQDFNGRYDYAVTDLDRYWNESVPSNIVITDALPSFPPTIISSTPTEGDTVLVNTSISLRFSKTMSISTLEAALSFTPQVGVAAINWWDYNTGVTITLSDSLAFDTGYALTIEATVSDINGVALDGNGDQIPGDPFILQFRTFAVDTTGPVILASYPDMTTPDSVRSEGVITFLFDELLTPASITDTTIILQSGETSVDNYFNVTNVGEYSVLSIQPFESDLDPGTEYTLLIKDHISDLLGNTIPDEILLPFVTSQMQAVETVILDNFLTTTSWEDPEYSGSTTGTKALPTTFGIGSAAYLPSARPNNRIAARLHVEWDMTKSEFLLREYLFGAPREITITSDHILQCQVFGDGSRNWLRFCLDDGRAVNPGHEVSQWIPIDWYGWRLVEWDLSNPASFGEWIGNGLWDNPNTLYFDSIQLTYVPGADSSATLYFDNLRAVKKNFHILETLPLASLPDRFRLSQNYPNPFNAVTNIPFYLPERRRIELAIYDILGRHIKTLHSGFLPAGEYLITWRGDTDTGRPAASGFYIVSLQVEKSRRTKHMVLLK
jgi:hypothetical protein